MIDTQAIRSKILDLAMRGRLTEQLPEDGTAEELYRQIQAEKQTLIKAGKIKKEKPLPEIADDEIPFEIPANWKWVRLGSIASVLGGKRIPAGRSLTQNDTGHKYIRVSDMKNRSVQTVGLLFVPEDIYPTISQYIINKEDVYITVAGTIGRVGKIPPEIDGANLTENADRIVFSHLNQDWLIFCLSASAIQKQIEMLTTSVALPKLAIRRIQEFQLPIPPLAEQHRIVARIEQAFSALDTIDTLQAKYADNLGVLKSKLIDAAIQGKLTEQLPEDGTAEELYRQIQAEKQALIKAGKIKKEKPLPEITADEIPFEIPKSWKWVRLADLCKSVMDGDHQPPPQVEDGIPFLVISNISKGVFDLSDVRHVPRDYYDSLSNERIAEKGDILFTVTGSFGIPVIVSIDGEFCFQRHMALLKPIVDGAYMHLALRSAHVHKYCDEVAIGTAQRTVGIKQLRRMPIPLPPLAEQKRIVERVSELLAVCDELKAPPN